MASKSAEILRLDFSGTIWFGAGVIGAGLPLAGLLSSGWRPADLPPVAQLAWWMGTVFVVVAITGFAYAGCPVLGLDIPTEDRYKSLAVRGGLMLFGLGTVMALLAVLLTPA